MAWSAGRMAAILCSKAGSIMILSLPVTGVFNTNAYFYVDDATGHGFLLDPGAEADTLLAVIRQRGFDIEKILLTHGHFDHMGAAAQIQDALSIPICMHERGREYTENPRWNLSEGCGLYIKLDDVSYLPDGSRIALERNPVFSLTCTTFPVILRTAYSIIAPRTMWPSWVIPFSRTVSG